MNHWHRHHSLRNLGGDWELRLRLQKSVTGSRLKLAVWRQPESREQCAAGEGSAMLRDGEGKATVEGTQEKVWTHRRDKAPLLGRGEEKGWATTIENSCPHVHMLALPHHRGWSIPSTAPCPVGSREATIWAVPQPVRNHRPALHRSGTPHPAL